MSIGTTPGKPKKPIHTEPVSSYTNGGHTIPVPEVDEIEDAVAIINDPTVQGAGILTVVKVDKTEGNVATITAKELDVTAATPAWTEVTDGTDIGDVKLFVEED